MRHPLDPVLPFGHLHLLLLSDIKGNWDSTHGTIRGRRLRSSRSCLRRGRDSDNRRGGHSQRPRRPSHDGRTQGPFGAFRLRRRLESRIHGSQSFRGRIDHMSMKIRRLVREVLAQDKSKERQEDEHCVGEDHDELVPSGQLFPGVLDFTGTRWLGRGSAADSFIHFSV